MENGEATFSHDVCFVLLLLTIIFFYSCVEVFANRRSLMHPAKSPSRGHFKWFSRFRLLNTSGNRWVITPTWLECQSHANMKLASRSNHVLRVGFSTCTQWKEDLSALGVRCFVAPLRCPRPFDTNERPRNEHFLSVTLSRPNKFAKGAVAVSKEIPSWNAKNYAIGFTSRDSSFGFWKIFGCCVDHRKQKCCTLSSTSSIFPRLVAAHQNIQ